MAYAVQATTHYQTYLERPPGADLPPQKVCNLGPMAPRSRKTVAIDVVVGPGDDTNGMVVVDRRSWAETIAPRVTVLTNVDTEGFREQLAFRFRKNAMRYFTKY